MYWACKNRITWQPLNFCTLKQERFRTGLLQQAEEFKKQAADLLREFENNGPFTSAIKTDDALANIEAVRAQMDALKEQEQTIRRGLNIFKIDQPPSKDIGTLEKVWVFFSLLYSNIYSLGC